MRGLFNNDDSLVRLSEVKARKIRWLWRGRIPLSKVTLMEGDPGIGKSWITHALAAAVSQGRSLADYKTLANPRNVLIFSAEDDPADTLKPRLAGLEANCRRIFAESIGSWNGLNFSRMGLSDLEQRITEHRAKLVIIDPLFAYAAGIDIYRPNSARAMMAGLARIAAERRCAILCIRHLGKAQKSKAIYRGLASIDFTASCRSVLLVGCNPKNKSERAVVHLKCNLGPLAPSLGYVIVDNELNFTGESDLTAEDLSAPEKKAEKPKDVARDFLENTLDGKPIRQKWLFKRARNAGISESTLRRAALELGVKKKRKGGVAGAGYWVWRLPGG